VVKPSERVPLSQQIIFEILSECGLPPGVINMVNGGREAGDRWVSDYTANCYHQACDDWSEQWDLRGALNDVTLVYEMVRELANSDVWPQWQTGAEFKQVRDASAAQRK